MQNHFFVNPAMTPRTALGATLGVMAAVLAALTAVPPALAQADYPSRPIRVIVPYAPGGTDQQLRLLAPALQKLLGQSLVIENIAGAGAAIGTAAVRNAKPDGYTLLYTGTGALTVAPNIGKTPYSMDDLVPVGNVIGTPFVVAAKPDAPFKTMAAMVAYGKANPEKISFGSAGHGTTTHIAGEATAGAGGFKLLHVPYQGIGPAVTSILGGNVDFEPACPTPSCRTSLPASFDSVRHHRPAALRPDARLHDGARGRPRHDGRHQVRLLALTRWAWRLVVCPAILSAAA